MAATAVWAQAPSAGPRRGVSDDRWSGVNVPAARMVFSDDDRDAVLSMIDDVLRTGSLTMGPYTRELGEAFRSRDDVPHEVEVSRGDSALRGLLRRLLFGGRVGVCRTQHSV